MRFRLIKSCSIEWKCLRLSNFNLRLDLIKISFFKVLTYLNRSGGKFYVVLKKKSAQSVHFYRFYGHFKFCVKINLHNFCLLNIAVKPVEIVRLSWFFFSKLCRIFSPIRWKRLESWKMKSWWGQVTSWSLRDANAFTQ